MGDWADYEIDKLINGYGKSKASWAFCDFMDDLRSARFAAKARALEIKGGAASREALALGMKLKAAGVTRG